MANTISAPAAGRGLAKTQSATVVFPGTPAVRRTVFPPVRDIADLLFRQIWFLAAAAIPLFAGAWFYASRPGQFESEMVLLIKGGRPVPALTPSTPTGAPQADGQMAVELEILTGTPVMAKTAERAGIAGDAGATPAQWLRKHITVAPVIKAGMIRVGFADDSAEQAAKVLRILSEVYMEEHLRVHATEGGEFFGKQTDETGARLRDAEAALSEFQRTHDVVLLKEQKDLTLRRMVEAEGSLRQAEIAEQESVRRSAGLSHAAKGMTTRVTTQVRRIPNQYAAERLSTMLVELNNKRTELLNKYRSDDRMVVQVDRQIADTRKALDAARSQVATEEATDVNGLRLNLEGDLIRANAEASAAQARAASLRGLVSRYRAELRRLEALSAEHQGLTRGVEELEASYRLHVRKQEESRIEKALDREKVANVVVSQSPQVPSKRKERSWAPAFVAATFGFAIVCMGAVTTGAARSRMFTPSALERATGLPVVATVAESRGRQLPWAPGPDSPGAWRIPVLALAPQSAPHGVGRVLAFTSTASGHGVSFAVEALANQLSKSGGARVLVIDSERLIQLDAAAVGANLKAYVSCSDGIFWLRQNGTAQASGTGHSLDESLDLLRQLFAFILVDCPALTESSDALTLANKTDGVLLVASAGGTGRREASRAQSVFASAGVPLSGCVLNRRTYPIPGFVYRTLFQ